MTATPDDARDSALDEERVAQRAELTGAERDAGSDDPERQAAQILADSDERTANRVDPKGAQPVEHRRSEDTVDRVTADAEAADPAIDQSSSGR